MGRLDLSLLGGRLGALRAAVIKNLAAPLVRVAGVVVGPRHVNFAGRGLGRSTARCHQSFEAAGFRSGAGIAR